MANKKMGRGILVIVLVFVMLLAGCATSVKANFSGKSENITVGVKNFTSVGLVFVECVVNKGSGERVTYDALLKAAAEKDADAIVNVNIDVKREGLRVLMFLFNPVETWYGSALAIKYTETMLERTAPVSNDKTGIPAAEVKAKSPAKVSGETIYLDFNKNVTIK
ncbi:MAG: hypothetical protein LBF80_04485 [Spirochaetaceae bacterium]|jgi:hypothetical protein|nr:hypothetical protein [Spirochaetaceae bacterium]